MDEAARELWGVYAIELSERYRLLPKAFEPGDERGPRRLLEQRWTPEQIRLGLNAAAALSARFPDQAQFLWDGRQTWEQDTLRTALKTFSMLAQADAARELAEKARMPVLRALPGGGS